MHLSALDTLSLQKDQGSFLDVFEMLPPFPLCPLTCSSIKCSHLQFFFFFLFFLFFFSHLLIEVPLLTKSCPFPIFIFDYIIWIHGLFYGLKIYYYHYFVAQVIPDLSSRNSLLLIPVFSWQIPITFWAVLSFLMLHDTPGSSWIFSDPTLQPTPSLRNSSLFY